MRIIVISEERQLTQRIKEALRTLKDTSPDLVLVMPPGGYRRRFLVRQGQKLQSISIDNIFYFYSEERFIFFRTRENQKFLVDYRIEELEKMLDPLIFFRVNRSFLISIHAIDQVHPYYGNRLKLQVLLSTPKDIIVSRDRIPDFRAWLGE